MLFTALMPDYARRLSVLFMRRCLRKRHIHYLCARVLRRCLPDGAPPFFHDNIHTVHDVRLSMRESAHYRVIADT